MAGKIDRLGDYWSGLVAFVRTAETGSFTAAAQDLGASPSAIGRAVTRLERRLGARLFKRSTRALVLTDEGRLLFDRARPAMATLREAEGLVGPGAAPVGIVRVSASVDLSRQLIGGWMRAFAAEHPGISLELNATDRLVDLRRDGVDVAVRVGSLPPAGVTGERIGTIGYAVVAAPGYLEARGTPGTPADLAGHACLRYLTNDGVPLRWTFAGRGWATDGPLATDDAGTLLAAALAGAGIAYMLRFAVADALDRGDLREIMPDIPKAELPVSIAHPFGPHPPARVRAVLRFLHARLAEVVAPPRRSSP
jgi:DNA-binding transcriptional LysR family regulator